MLLMKDIVREGHPVLREVAKEVELPLSAEDLALGEEMMIFLKNSQDKEMAEKYELRGGVGLAAPQLAISKRIIALLVPSNNPEKPEPLLNTVMYNPKIVSHSVQSACLADGEGCLSVDREVPGYVVRHARVTVEYVDANGQKQKIRLKNYPAIVVQHEIDHLNGIMFYDHIASPNPFALAEDVLVLE
ncbi:peptide deformylase [Enterococcus columbae]|uniref:Peptide deformylase n=1 Tax=Enterococcus columbae DSM 7374 = ATCC 51263 TaxID=1121865 RepID=S1NDI4_9ENTE|nr:peptide deformylase [Enterococcus columbae]EOT38046.1 peptide deformylase [Enterococcus columbae DSM 7374 = ATCC 51263]EOW83713.1 peptide deformylase [Enterococcus columbae DSM 7374 = ATCC 51263]OJG20393.1 peptide deformylase [Enterococcus columbae DSM 7374 = ATCC 51263]